MLVRHGLTLVVLSIDAKSNASSAKVPLAPPTLTATHRTPPTAVQEVMTPQRPVHPLKLNITPSCEFARHC